MSSLVKTLSIGLLSLTSVVLLAPLKYLYLTNETTRDNQRTSRIERYVPETGREQEHNPYQHRKA